MEQIGHTIGRMLAGESSSSAYRNTQPSPEHSDSRALETSKSVTALTSRYGSRQQMLQTFHISNQMRYTADEERCYFGNAPTMGMTNTAYGKKTAQEWITYQLADLSEFCGAKDKITAFQIEQLAEIIAEDYHWLKLTEVMLFFRKFKKGEYGRFYGAVDPLIITTALREFLRDRNNAYFKHDQQEREAREARERKMPAITREEYLRRKAAREVSEQKQKEIANITTKVYEHQEPTESR